jgi:hypothetical protein
VAPESLDSAPRRGVALAVGVLSERSPYRVSSHGQGAR